MRPLWRRRMDDERERSLVLLFGFVFHHYIVQSVHYASTSVSPPLSHMSDTIALIHVMFSSHIASIAYCTAKGRVLVRVYRL